MIRPTILITDLVLSVLAVVVALQNLLKPPVEVVAQFDRHQPSGIAVSNTGRMFVSFPFWSDEHRYTLVEVLADGTLLPYPNKRWNSWRWDNTACPSKTFVSVQSLFIDDHNVLWALDAGSPRMANAVPGGPKLVKLNLYTSQVEQVIALDDCAAPKGSYLNDVRVDATRNIAYVADCGLGAILVVDLGDGTVRRTLEGHYSTKSDPGVTVNVAGKRWADRHGRTPQIHANGIALSPGNEYLYYRAMTGRTLFRVPTDVLRNSEISAGELAQAVERVAETVVCDGIQIDAAGNVYLTAVEQHAIMRLTPERTLETLVQDERIQWPGSIALRQDLNGNHLYFTTSQVHHMPRFNSGESTRTLPYYVMKLTLPADDQRLAAAR